MFASKDLCVVGNHVMESQASCAIDNLVNLTTNMRIVGNHVTESQASWVIDTLVNLITDMCHHHSYENRLIR